MTQQTLRAAVKGKHILIRVPHGNQNLCMSVTPYQWDDKMEAWKYPKSATIARELLKAFRGWQVIGDDAFAELVQQAKAFKSATEAKQGTEETLSPIPITNDEFPPWLHQLRLYHFARHMPAVYVNIGMGGGKSRSFVDMVRNRNHKRVLIACPASVVGVWPKEFRKHGFTDAMVVPLGKSAGSVAKRVKQAKHALELGQARNQTVVLVINYESLWREEFAKFAMKAGFDFVMTDEAHKGKSPSGKASMFLAKLGAVVPYRWCMSGTPMPHDPLDIFAQYKFLDPGIFGTSFTTFKQRYGKWGGFQNKQFQGLREELEAEFHQKMYTIMFRVPQEDLDKTLPPFTHVQKFCELGDEALRIYKELDKDMIAGVHDGTVTTANALTKLLRHQQLTGGFVTDDDGQIRQVDTAKMNLLDDIVEDIGEGEPIVVFCRFTNDLEAVKQIAEKHNLKYGEVSGRQNDLEDGMMPEHVDIMGVNIQAGGAGVDLTRARYAVYYSVGFNMGDYEQSLKRSHRHGQTRPVTYIHLIAQRTVDEKVYKALTERKKIVESILDEIRGGTWQKFEAEESTTPVPVGKQREESTETGWKCSTCGRPHAYAWEDDEQTCVHCGSTGIYDASDDALHGSHSHSSGGHGQS